MQVRIPAPASAPAPVPEAQPVAAKPLYPQPQAQQPAAQPQAAPAQPAAPSAVQNIRSAAAATDAQRGLNFASSSNGGLTGLIVISAVLLAVYLGIRTFGKKRLGRDPEIQVLSARRLGHRSELLLVRALGSDHLLMTSAGRVERVASAPSPSEPSVPSLSLPPPPMAAEAQGDTAESQAEGLGIITKLSSRSRLRKLLDAVDQEPDAEPAPAPRNSGRPSFGPELLSAIHHHKLNAIASLPSVAQNAGKQSDAVAGIARLRAGSRGPN
ncbi:MAG TPA: hypothetical protein VJR89_00295 [Polyangiales bacterium]|nr:hypothetical protein [Polyangiales bacterium]